ncbi:MAG: glutamine--fructose-6-phosphate transaminase (isomerizing) [Chloroflexota bacterium]
MCGIVGYIGERDALPLLLNSLERVTYRGYDSFGVALLNGHGIELYKALGSVDQQQGYFELRGSIGIGHTRWATVGAVSERNAHPHTDCTGEIAIVHNGDIDNYQTLKCRLEGLGHVFRSETDSEVVAHLIEAYGPDDIVRATRRATGELEGTFALGILHRSSRQLVVTKKGSPLVIGLGEGENYVASDVPALLPYTNRVVYLEDGDIASISAEGLKVWHGEIEVRRRVHQIEWSANQLHKNGYAQYMLKEIHEQPQAIRDTLASYDGHATDVAQLDSELSARDWQEILLLGCGTSYHAAMVGEYVLSHLPSIQARAVVASEFDAVTSNGAADNAKLAIALSQSGETADTISALRLAQDANYTPIAVSNVFGSSISRIAAATLYTRAGPEVAVASTKSFTTQLVALYSLAARLDNDSEMAQVIAAGLRSLPSKIEEVLAGSEHIQRVATSLAPRDQMFIVGKGVNTPVAMEGALKFKEVAYLHAEGYAAGELKHGPFALLEEGTPVIAIVPSDAKRLRVLTTVREVKSRGAKVIAIAPSGDDEVQSFADEVLYVPEVDPILAPVLNTVVFQLLSYYCALDRGYPIDRPRNLAKSVTVH